MARVGANRRIGTVPGKQREAEKKQSEVEKRMEREKRGGQVKDVIAPKVPGESDDAK
ncbi:hypothetical protein GBF38_005374 [Nibea albiflora]|uniref:Uncharacterized protein n=1 Tax=Nibea albiflora TaxID=240163 RepID=A0ACB7EWR7_NIBAL|nr:hypothetical protein GBF38_005374 [Nibea albiflora]